MSAPKTTLPILDGFVTGEAISCHDGVRCYPAIRRDTNEKYIVKVISVPASGVQLDALLLTGAFAGREAALEYFMDLSRDMVRETEILNQLGQQEGFIPYEDARIVPMADGGGYEVLLLGTYKRSMEKILSSETMTQRGVVNMGLDLCAALAACRRAGYLYVDLKPGNVFHTQKQGYRIGDVGFASLDSLQYASLPEKYRSSYSAPELRDDMAVLNATVDIYALGLLLYQACNGGALPFEGLAPAEPLAPPLYADYEMAEIILKACDPDPSNRWQDPAQMAQAIVAYMQRNDVTDAPMIPPAAGPLSDFEAEPEPFLPEPPEEDLPEGGNAAEVPEELAFLTDLTSDDTAPSEESAGELTGAALSDEASEMLAQADALIAHPLPDPPVAPEPIEVPMPAPIEPAPEAVPQSAPQPVPDPPEQETDIIPDAGAETQSGVKMPPDAPVLPAQKPPVKEKKGKRPFPWRLTAIAALLALVLLLAVFGKIYYEKQYLQNIESIGLTVNEDMLTVKIVSHIDDSLLTVVCTDGYGNTFREPVAAGIAVFRDLNPDTRYNIAVEIKGFHKLTGVTSDSCTTPQQTKITGLTAGIGPADGSVVLHFQVEGAPMDAWILRCTAEGQPERSVPFTGNSVTVENLIIGTRYTFTLSSADGQKIIGQTQIDYTVARRILAENLTITACGGGSLSAAWTAPAGAEETRWIVRCYNSAGYNESITTTDLSCTFTGLDHTTMYTVDVTAEGMEQSVSTHLAANPTIIDSFRFHISAELGITVTWTFSGEAPESGWILRYSVDNYPQQSVTTDTNSASVYALPGGKYTFTVEAAGGEQVFGGEATYALTEVGSFGNYGVSAENMDAQMCLRPGIPDWTPADVAEEDYRNTFAPGEAAALILHTIDAPEASSDSIQVQFILHDGEHTLLRVDTQILIWDNMWEYGFCPLNIPYLPAEAGSYSLGVYFNGCFVTEQIFSIT